MTIPPDSPPEAVTDGKGHVGDAGSLLDLRWWIGGSLAALVTFIGVMAGELGSLERANRTFRSGRFVEATAAYRRHVDADDTTRIVAYNLGTAMMRSGLDGEEATDRLAGALNSPDSAVGTRANYNLGYRYLMAALSEPERDSALVGARLAVGLNLQALRLDPSSGDARWNLAIAQRTFDSLIWIANRPDEAFPPDSLRAREEQDLMATALRRIQDRSGSLGGHFFSRGEREALAKDVEGGALSSDEAGSMLARMVRSPEYVLRRIFLMQSPNRWGSRGGSRKVW